MFAAIDFGLYFGVPAEFGGMWGWGDNVAGTLGLRNTTAYSSPKQVGEYYTWYQSSTNSGSSAVVSTNIITGEGTLWSWGFNTSGELGLGTAVTTSSPVQVGSAGNWTAVSMGGFGALAIRGSGTLWSWGQNQYGQLGQDDIINRSSPTQIGLSANWINASAGGLAAAAVKSDHTLWTWGNNSFGQLGHGDLISRSSPTQVGALANWLSVSAGKDFMLAVKTNNTLWAWGNNNYGQLGLHNTTSYSSPKQVGLLTNWLTVSAGAYQAAGTKINSTLWTWGHNNYGQLGIGNTFDRSSPTQVGGMNNWLYISVGDYMIGAIKSGGTLWTWGDNRYGQLGLGDSGVGTSATSRSSPVQVGALINWAQVSAGTGSMLGINDNAAPPTPAVTDPFFAEVVSLVHCDNVGSYVPIDVIPGNTWLNSLNNRLVVSATLPKFGPGSIYKHTDIISGNIAGSIYNPVGFTNPSGFMTTWTAEFYMNFESFWGGWAADYNRFFAIAGIGYILYVNRDTGKLWIITPGFVSTETSQIISTGAWYYYALVSDGAQLSLYVNGNLIQTLPGSHNVNGSAISLNGCSGGNGDFHNGFFDEFRFTKNIARYSGASYPVPTGPFLDS